MNAHFRHRIPQNILNPPPPHLTINSFVSSLCVAPIFFCSDIILKKSVGVKSGAQEGGEGCRQTKGFALYIRQYVILIDCQTSYSFAFVFENSTLFEHVPTPSSSTSTTSPSFSQTCGFLPIPTPCGVPVKIKSPGSRVVP